MSRTIARNGDDCSQRIDEVESQVPAVQEQWRYSYARCRVCFRETEGSSRCQGSRCSCSGWSDLPVPSWTAPFHDVTDGRGGGCTYQWHVQCRRSRESIYNDTAELNASFCQPDETQPITTTTIPARHDGTTSSLASTLTTAATSSTTTKRTTTTTRRTPSTAQTSSTTTTFTTTTTSTTTPVTADGEDINELGREMDDLLKEIQLVAEKLGKFAAYILSAYSCKRSCC